MSSIKIQVNDASVEDFLHSVADKKRREDSLKLLEIFKKATGLTPKMWGGSIVGYGQYHYKSERSTQEGDWPLTGFSPRKQALTIYIMPGFDEHVQLLEKIGKHTTSVSCLYVKKLADIDLKILEELIHKSVVQMKKMYNVE